MSSITSKYMVPSSHLRQLLRTSILLAVLATVTAEVNVVSKAEWKGAEAGTGLTQLQLPVRRIIICHTAGADCSDRVSCGKQVRNIQTYQMEALQFDDIGYNFLIGNDGNVYEGRGWDHQGAFARGYNAGSLGIAFIGNYGKIMPNESALAAANQLLELGVRTGKISEDYRLHGHSQMSATDSPGETLYAAIKLWPQWSRQIAY